MAKNNVYLCENIKFFLYIGYYKDNGGLFLKVLNY